MWLSCPIGHAVQPIRERLQTDGLNQQKNEALHDISRSLPLVNVFLCCTLSLLSETPEGRSLCRTDLRACLLSLHSEVFNKESILSHSPTCHKQRPCRPRSTSLLHEYCWWDDLNPPTTVGVVGIATKGTQNTMSVQDKESSTLKNVLSIHRCGLSNDSIEVKRTCALQTEWKAKNTSFERVLFLICTVNISCSFPMWKRIMICSRLNRSCYGTPWPYPQMKSTWNALHNVLHQYFETLTSFCKHHRPLTLAIGTLKGAIFIPKSSLHGALKTNFSDKPTSNSVLVNLHVNLSYEQINEAWSH